MVSFLTVTFGQVINALQVVQCSLKDCIDPIQASVKPTVMATFREAAALDSGVSGDSTGDGVVVMFGGG